MLYKFFSNTGSHFVISQRSQGTVCHEWLRNTGRKLCNLVPVIIKSLGFYITSVCSVFLSWMSFLTGSQHAKHFCLSRSNFALVGVFVGSRPEGWQIDIPSTAAGKMVGKSKFSTVMIMATGASRAIQ